MDFLANIYYKTAEEGGRNNPVAFGYRPDFVFEFSSFFYMAHQDWIDKEIVYPGEWVKTKVTLASPKLLKGKLSKEMNFTINEGPFIVGTGCIEEIINQELVKS